MGRRGPLPQPTALKLATGNPGKRRLNEGEPIPPSDPVVAPAWLSEKALIIWRQISPTLVAMQTLTVADVSAFGRWCELMARYLELKAFVYSKGAGGGTYPILDSEGRTRYIQELPQAAELRKVQAMLVQLEDRFGMSPAARSRINVEHSLADAMGAMGVPSADRERQAWFAGGGPASTRAG